MESEEKRKLSRILELTEENNEKLTKLYRGMQWRRVFTFLYWIVIIGFAAGAFYFIQPYFNQFTGVFERFQGSAQGVQEYFNSDSEPAQEEGG